MRFRRTPFLSSYPLRQQVGSVIGLAAGWLGCLCPITLIAEDMGAPGPGLLEVGAPLFTVRSPESLGLSSRPTDLHVMPDGRILVFAAQQLALGDGTRWNVFRQAADDPPVPATGVAVAADGEIYLAATAGFARLELDENADWRATIVAPWSGADRVGGAVPRTIAQAGSEWLWHSGSGAVASWRPGESVRVIGRTDSIQHVFQLRGTGYLSDRIGGALWRLGPGGMESVAYADRSSASDTITSAAEYDEEQMLVGTYARGLRIFDGRTLRPFITQGQLAGNLQVNDLCMTAHGYYAAAIETIGVVFFDRAGRVVQVLDRGCDQRLSHVQRIVAAPGGVIWGILSDGVLCVEFPSRISHFEPLIGSGIDVAHPFRLDRQLGVLADGVVRHAVYNADGRMTELRVDTPPGRFASNPSTTMGALVVATERGAFHRASSGWVEFAPEIDNLRLIDHPPIGGRWIFGATGRTGWITPKGEGFEIQQFPEPKLEKIYHSVADEEGSIWLELGNGRVGRMQVADERVHVDYFGAEHGVPDSWAQIFQLDGQVRFNIGDQILRFDDRARRFVRDLEFDHQFPGLSDIVGRPGRDPRGRVWITANGGVQVLEQRDGVWRNQSAQMPAGFLPYYFTFQPDGVVWMHASGRLARFDPAMPVAPEAPLGAMITRIVVSATQRSLYPSAPALKSLPFSANSLVVHFCAPGSAFKPVDFDVWLEGGSPGWTSSGSAGSAAFNQLREGKYLLHVRPRSGQVIGTEAAIELVILPPWYRTPPAYGAYALATLGVILLIGRILLYFQRHEHTQLERLVAQRTRELHATNERLAAQVEENQVLSKAIEQSPAAIFITDPKGTIIFANPRGYELNGRTGNALVGEPLRSVRAASVTPELFGEIDRTVARGETWRGQLANRRADGHVFQVRSVIAPIRTTNGEVRHHLVLEEDITESLGEQDRRRRLESQLIQAQKLETIGTLAGGIAHDFNNILTAILGYCELAGLDSPNNEPLQRDLAGIRSAGTRAKELVARILTFSRQTHVQLVPLDLAQPVEEALRLVRASAPSSIELVATLESGMIRADSTQIQQVVLNLCTNSVQALPNQRGRIEVTVQRVQVSPEIAAEITELWVGDAMRLVITDDGYGMDAATLRRIFDPFFTTKRQGEGTGLGLAIVQGVVVGHEGAIRVRSNPGAGTSVEIYFPVSAEVSAKPKADLPVPRGQQQEIIVVDDERSVANFAATRLHQLGYRPVVFGSPQAALNAFAAQPTRFNALVTDLTMPHLTGADLIRQIRSRGWLIPAVIITGYQGDAIRANVKALPRCLVVPKPFTGEDLARALHQVINDYGIRR